PEVELALRPDVAAVLHVISHHTVQAGMLPLEQVVPLAHRHSIPVIVDAAAEVDLHRYIAAGADLVIYSGHKAIGGPTSGMIAGRADLIAACRLQNQGAGRAMKIGKEGIIGFLTALEVYRRQAAEVLEERTRSLAGALADALAGVEGLSVELARDETRPIWRVQLRLSSGARARHLIALLEAGDPVVKTRNHQAGSGIINLDTRTLEPEQVAELAGRIREGLREVVR
ncbi:MAG TPA: aminotransferase class V-fold PLP-dependent enzyme, partial [Symbiobacteriaceae bacterium]|nr:aminotransferase class V-fold PLP-dependent enzyme [Symbiobacteriaceae bacterium]